MKTMRAAVFEGNGILKVKDVPIPEIQSSRDVKVKVEAAAICGSDLHILSIPQGQRGDVGTIMGHEFVARVDETGSEVTLVKPGDRVVIEPNIPCGLCPECRSGHRNMCRNAKNTGQWKDGGFAEYCVIPETQLHLIPESIPAREAALAEPMACVMHALIRTNPLPFEKILLFGAGAIGQIFICALREFGVRNIAVCELSAEKRQKALELGAEVVYDSSDDSWKEDLISRWGCQPDIAIDAVGAGAVLPQCMDIVKTCGKVVVFGQNLTQHSDVRPGLINAKELNLYATLAVNNSFPATIELMKRKSLGIGRIVTHEFPLEEINQGIELMRAGKTGKVIIYPQPKNAG